MKFILPISNDWTHDKILGNYLHETIILPQYHEQHLQGIEHLKNTGQATMLNQRVEISARHNNDKEVPVELTISQLEIKDGNFYSAFVRDLTEIKQAELKLAATTFYSHKRHCYHRSQ